MSEIQEINSTLVECNVIQPVGFEPKNDQQDIRIMRPNLMLLTIASINMMPRVLKVFKIIGTLILLTFLNTIACLRMVRTGVP